MTGIVRRLALVAASFSVVLAAFGLASLGEGEALPGVERAFTTPERPVAKSADRLLRLSAGGGRVRTPPAAVVPPAPARAPAAGDAGEDHASLIAWSRAFADLADALPSPPQAADDLSRLR